jgi:hypothetical protein
MSASRKQHAHRQHNRKPNGRSARRPNAMQLARRLNAKQLGLKPNATRIG